MPMLMDINQETIMLYMTLLRKSVEDQYRGHEDYHLIKKEITPEGFVGGKVTVKKRNPKDKTFRTVTYNVTVLDSLGYPLYGIEDVGGRCKHGELAKKGHIFKCIRCHRLFCEKHIRFFNYDDQYPLCEGSWSSCFPKYQRIHDRSEELKLKTLITRREQDLAMAKGDHLQALIYGEKGDIALENLRDSRPGLLEKMFGIVPFSKSFHCPHCEFSPSYYNVTCQSCGEVFKLRGQGPRRCPYCNTIVTEIHCFRCNQLIYT